MRMVASLHIRVVFQMHEMNENGLIDENISGKALEKQMMTFID